MQCTWWIKRCSNTANTISIARCCCHECRYHQLLLYPWKQTACITAWQLVNITYVAVVRPFSDDVTHTRKFDYYSADHAWGGEARAVKCIAFYGKTQPAQAFLRVNSAVGVPRMKGQPCLWSRESAFIRRLLQPRATFPHRDTACWKSPFLFETHNLYLSWWVDLA